LINAGKKQSTGVVSTAEQRQLEQQQSSGVAGRAESSGSLMKLRQRGVLRQKGMLLYLRL